MDNREKYFVEKCRNIKGYINILNFYHNLYYQDEPLKSNYERVLFPTGYVKDIKWAKQYKNTYINHCDCCSKSLDNKPWSKQYCLCNNCVEQLDYYVQKDKIPYKDRESIYSKYINNTSDRVVIEMNYGSI